MALGCSAMNAIRLVDLAITGDGPDWPCVPCRPLFSCKATDSTLGQLKYLSSYRNNGFPTSVNLESKFSVRTDVVGKQLNAHILTYLAVTYQ